MNETLTPADYITERLRIHAAVPGERWDCYGDGEFEFYDSTEYDDGDLGEVLGDSRALDISHAIVDAHNHSAKAWRAIEKVLELHRPVHQVFSWQTGGMTTYDPCETCFGKAGVHECGCWADEDLAYTCASCRNDRGNFVSYPCNERRAITEILGVSDE